MLVNHTKPNTIFPIYKMIWFIKHWWKRPNVSMPRISQISGFPFSLTGCPRPFIGNRSIIDVDKEWYGYGETVYIKVNCPTGLQPSSEYRNFVCTNNGTWYREIPYCKNQSKFDCNCTVSMCYLTQRYDAYTSFTHQNMNKNIRRWIY